VKEKVDVSRIVVSFKSFLCNIFLSLISIIVLGLEGKEAWVEELISTEGKRSLR